ncbi:MAG: PfkB family carbohydrate kinase, partial [Pygmaiobacter sp.]
DLTAFLSSALASYRAQHLVFDCVYTGYLANPAQAGLVGEALAAFGAQLIVVDPVMADGGRFYTGFDETMACAMRALCAKADLITPNPTEAALLLKETLPVKALCEEALCEQAQALAACFDTAVLLTGAPLCDGRTVVAGCARDGTGFFMLPCAYVNAQYPGTGDLFTAVLTGALLRGKTLSIAARMALSVTEKAVHTTYQAGTDPRFGVAFEPLLTTLEDFLCR